MATANKVLAVAVAGFFAWFLGMIIHDMTIGRGSVPDRVVPIPDDTYVVLSKPRPTEGDGHGPGRDFYLSSEDLSESEMTDRVVAALSEIGWELCADGPADNSTWYSTQDLESEFSLQMWGRVSDGTSTTSLDEMVPAGQTVVWISIDGKPDRGNWTPGDDCVPVS